MQEDNTRNRILNAASDVFVEKGFRGTTIRDICAAADANVAAVNYHFGDKRRLYSQVLAKWMEDFVAIGDLTKGITSESTPVERLRAYIRSELKSLCTFDDPGGIRRKRVRLLLQEIATDRPSQDVFECHEKEEHKVLFPIVEAIVGPMEPVMFEKTCRAAAGILTHYFLESVYDPDSGFKSLEELEEMTDFLTTYVVGGLTAIKEKYNA